MNVDLGDPMSDVQVSDVGERVRAFILDSLLLGDAARLPGADDSLIETGVIDSTGVLELIEYLEQEFGIRVEDAETIPANLDSIGRIVAFTERKRG